MDLIDRLKTLALNIKNRAEALQTEEATKTNCIMPFIDALGYDIFNVSEVVPEFTADFGLKKGEKVDFAILHEGEPSILIECKKFGANLEEVQASQLYRYFSVTKARIGILTNGRIYKIYTDLDEKNKMDDRPFLTFDIFDFSDGAIREIKKLSKSAFNVDDLMTTAGELKYTGEIRKYIAAQYNRPDDAFVKLITSQVYTGLKTKTVLENFRNLTLKALKEFVDESINKRLEAAKQGEEAEEKEMPTESVDEPAGNTIVTTDEELNGYYIVKSILRDIVAPSRITFKDTRTYFSITFDGRSHSPLCRLFFNAQKSRSIGIFVNGEEGRKMETYHIKNLDDIYTHSDQLRAIARVYLDEK